MANDVSSWFVDQSFALRPPARRRFLLAGSDHTARVTRWPRFVRTANELKSVEATVRLANDDGALNNFWTTAITMVASAELAVGFTHPNSGTEWMPLYTGELKTVAYSATECEVRLRDRLWAFTERTVGDTDNPVEIPTSGGQLVSDVAWTLCTCYGGLSAVASTSNPDIDYEAFGAWAAAFSSDTILIHTRYTGERVSEALQALAQMADSAVVVEGDGRLRFMRFEEASSLDTTLSDEHYAAMVIDVDTTRMVNRQKVSFNYAPKSDYWLDTVTSVRSLSVESFGVHEALARDESVWYVDSPAAINLATRRTLLLNDPPSRFQVETGLAAAHLQIGDTVRLHNSFYNITSAQGWRLVEFECDLDGGRLTRELDGAAVMNGFYLDVSFLDGDDVLL